MGLVVIYHIFNDNADRALMKIRQTKDLKVKYQLIEDNFANLITESPKKLLEILNEEITSFGHLKILPWLLNAPDYSSGDVIAYLVSLSTATIKNWDCFFPH